MDQILAKKSLGQNFLKDENVLKKIADSFSVTEQDVIVEIGPGKGALTKYLIQKPSSLICYELDSRMQEILLPFENGKCKIIFDDFLKRDLLRDVASFSGQIFVIANIPYYITTPIISHVLESNIKISGMTLLVQKEVAERFIAKPKSRDYGYFTVLLNHFFIIEKLFDVSPQAFTPAPRVWSSVVRFIRKINIVDLDIKQFDNFLKKAFSQKRKTLKNNLKEYDSLLLQASLKELHYSENARAEELSYDDFVKLFCKLV